LQRISATLNQKLPKHGCKRLPSAGIN